MSIKPLDQSEKLTVLIVEDEALLRGLVCDVLEDEGVNFKAFETADDALEFLYIQASDVNLVLTDVLMPGRLNGADLAAIISRKWPAIPTIVTSGYTGVDVEIPKRSTFLPKPWDLATLKSKINQALGLPYPE